VRFGRSIQTIYASDRPEGKKTYKLHDSFIPKRLVARQGNITGLSRCPTRDESFLGLFDLSIIESAEKG
jgi:hypothetical protein